MTGRPRPDEAAPYHFNYIDLVAGDDAVTALELQLTEAVSLFAAIPEDKSLHRYAPEKWSIREILNHVTDAERIFSVRALWFARGFDGPMPGFDQDTGVKAASANSMAFASHVEEFQRVRLATVSLFAHLPEEAWAKTGVASNQRVSVRGVAFLVAGHLAHHLKVLREHYL